MDNKAGGRTGLELQGELVNKRKRRGCCAGEWLSFFKRKRKKGLCLTGRDPDGWFAGCLSGGALFHFSVNNQASFTKTKFNSSCKGDG